MLNNLGCCVGTTGLFCVNISRYLLVNVFDFVERYIVKLIVLQVSSSGDQWILRRPAQWPLLWRGDAFLKPLDEEKVVVEEWGWVLIHYWLRLLSDFSAIIDDILRCFQFIFARYYNFLRLLLIFKCFNTLVLLFKKQVRSDGYWAVKIRVWPLWFSAESSGWCCNWWWALCCLSERYRLWLLRPLDLKYAPNLRFLAANRSLGVAGNPTLISRHQKGLILVFQLKLRIVLWLIPRKVKECSFLVLRGLWLSSFHRRA